jgi:hypothetical protein
VFRPADEEQLVSRGSTADDDSDRGAAIGLLEARDVTRKGPGEAIEDRETSRQPPPLVVAMAGGLKLGSSSGMKLAGCRRCILPNEWRGSGFWTGGIGDGEPGDPGRWWPGLLPTTGGKKKPGKLHQVGQYPGS